jgi:chemotaxis protein methyltransferase CheR
LKKKGMATFAEYLKYLKKGDPEEVELFSNAVTTNLTSFFRENHHFEYLADTILPEIVQKRRNGSRRVRIWSAGCSTGEEPYSIAMTLRESMKDLSRWDAKVLCTDLDTDVISTCEKGVYASNRVEKVPDGRLRRWFRKSTGPGPELYKVDPKLQELLTFKQLNLMHDWPMKGRFDVIFCRNVVIYFDKPTQRVLVERYANMLEDGGYLILGHSESLFKVSDRFSLLGNTIYQKTA